MEKKRIDGEYIVLAIINSEGLGQGQNIVGPQMLMHC